MARILLIEDNYPILDSMAFILTLEGHEVIEATGGREGLGFVDQFQPDLVVCDVVMPGVDGYEVLRTIRAQSLVPNVPIVLISASDISLPNRRKCRDANAFVKKPFELDHFLGVVNDLLQPPVISN